MVENGYWVECFPASQKSNTKQELYTALIEGLPQATCTDESIDKAIDALRSRLINIQKSYIKNGMSLPKSHSLSCPVAKHRTEENWMSVYINLDNVISSN